MRGTWVVGDEESGNSMERVYRVLTRIQEKYTHLERRELVQRAQGQQDGVSYLAARRRGR